MDFIRRASLDAFWSIEHVTIGSNLAKMNGMLQISRELGVENPHVPLLGIWSVGGKFVMSAALILLKHSLDPDSDGNDGTV
jgi:hypothetical protein